MPILASSPNENKPTEDSSILLCSPETPHHDVSQEAGACSGGLRGGGWQEDGEREREGSHRSSRQSCGEWQLNEESLFVLIQNHPLSLHDYFPVMH
jgi:hypothetical protein